MFQTRQKDIQKVSCKGQRLTRGPEKLFFPSFKFGFAIRFAFSFQNHVNPNPGIQEQILQRKIDSTARYAYFGKSGKFRLPIGMAPKNVD